MCIRPSKISISLCLLVISICIGHSSADEPVITNKTGQAYEIHWPDGRIASLVRSKSEVKQVEVPVGVTSSQCGFKLPKTCSWILPYQVHSSGLQWKKHSEANRIGDWVRFKNMVNDGVHSRVFLRSYTVTAFGIQLEGRRTLELHNNPVVNFEDLSPKLHCDSWDWLPDHEEIKIRNFSVQGMQVNADTELNENYLNTLLMNMKLHRKRHDPSSGSYYQVDTFGEGTLSDIRNIENSTYLWDIEDGRGATCQVTIQYNYSKLMFAEAALVDRWEGREWEPVLGEIDWQTHSIFTSDIVEFDQKTPEIKHALEIL